jgi:hypothetical protein
MNLGKPTKKTYLLVGFSAGVEIDMAILEVLGYSEDEAKQLLDNLYPALANEIGQLKTLMQG